MKYARIAVTLSFLMAAAGWSGAAGAQAMKLTNEFAGKGKCLDIVNDGKNNKLIMAKCEDVSGQAWEVETLKGEPYVRLKTEFTGPGKCLDIVNDGANDKVTMAPCGNFTGQFWSMTVQGGAGNKAHFRMTSKFTGPKRCLDIVNDGKNNQLTMADCGDYTGQIWYGRKAN